MAPEHDSGYPTRMDERAPSQVLMGRARGVMIGSPIAFGWAFFGASGFGPVIRYALLAVALVITAALLRASAAMRRRAGAMAAPTPTQIGAGRRTWLWFWLNFVGEVILLNIAIRLLAAPDLRDYWVPAISAVVGLHFWPMAHCFRARSYYGVGAAMLAGAAATAALIGRDRDAVTLLVHGEALLNATILWIALGAGALAARLR